MTDFNKPINLCNDIETTFKGKKIILKKIYLYEGPITRQLLPYGGIQSIMNYAIIINCINGFIASNEVVYDNISMSSKEFILKFGGDIVNQVLPN